MNRLFITKWRKILPEEERERNNFTDIWNNVTTYLYFFLWEQKEDHYLSFTSFNWFNTTTHVSINGNIQDSFKVRYRSNDF